MIVFLSGACVGKHLGPKDTSLYALKIDGEELQILDGQKEFFTNIEMQRKNVKIEVKTQGDNHPSTDAASVAGIFFQKNFSVESMEIFDDQGKRKVPNNGTFELQPGINIFHIGVVAGDKRETSAYEFFVHRGLLPQVTYPRILYESTKNDGSLSGVLQVQLEPNDFPSVTFSGANGATWSVGNEYEIQLTTDVLGQKFISGIPEGLSLQIQKKGPTLIALGVTGSASAHSASNSTFVDIFLKEKAFQKNSLEENPKLLDELLKNPIFFRIDFGDSFLRSSISSFAEMTENNGILTPSSVDLETTFVNFSVQTGSRLRLEKHYKVYDLPKGIWVEILCTSPTKAVLTLRGYAYTHKKKNSGKFTIQFLDSAFEGKSAESISGSRQIYTFQFRDA